MPRERIYTVREIIAMLAEFGIGAEEAVSLLRAQDMPGLKKRLKEGWYKLAFRLHPDRGGDAEEFKRVSGLYSALQKLQPAAPPSPPPGIFDGSPVRVEVVVMDFTGGFGYGTATNTATWSSWDRRRW